MKKKKTAVPPRRRTKKKLITASNVRDELKKIEVATERSSKKRERARVAGRDPVSKKKTEQVLDGSKDGSIFTSGNSKPEMENAAFAALKRADPKLYYEHFVGNRIDQELFRSAIARDDHYDKIMGCVDSLEKVEAWMTKRRNSLTKAQASACSLHINSIKSRLATHFKMLDKLLPDAVAQLSMSDTPEVLAMKLRKALNAMQEVDTDRVIDA